MKASYRVPRRRRNSRVEFEGASPSVGAKRGTRSGSVRVDAVADGRGAMNLALPDSAGARTVRNFLVLANPVAWMRSARSGIVAPLWLFALGWLAEVRGIAFVERAGRMLDAAIDPRAAIPSPRTITIVAHEFGVGDFVIFPSEITGELLQAARRIGPRLAELRSCDLGDSWGPFLTVADRKTRLPRGYVAIGYRNGQYELIAVSGTAAGDVAPQCAAVARRLLDFLNRNSSTADPRPSLPAGVVRVLDAAPSGAIRRWSLRRLPDRGIVKNGPR